MHLKPYIIISICLFALCAVADIFWFFNQDTAPDFLIVINAWVVVICIALVIVQAVLQKNNK